MKNVIIAGGVGSRLWPLSRKLLPKQFLSIFNKESLFQKTIKRNRDICDDFIIVTNEEHYFLALDQLEEIDKGLLKRSLFLLEEIGKNTAPAIAFAAFSSNKDDILFVTPSDHLIKNEKEYIKIINEAKKYANDNYLITFGIKPTFANTGYGYIEAKEGDGLILDVVSFYEKPSLEIAEKYIKENEELKNNNLSLKYYWNSGMFMFKAGVYLEELQKHSPDIFEACKEIYENNLKEVDKNRYRITNMQDIREDSIDYAVMEKSDKIKMAVSSFEWNDVGSFDSLIQEMDLTDGIEIDSKNSFYYSDTNKLIATIGVEDLIIIDTKDALLISKKGETQKVKELVKKLKSINPSLLTTHSIVHRPWGSFETLIDEKGYKIKKIVVKPGKRLSLQKHFHRNEHWIVVSGTAEVRVGDKTYLVRPNESTYIKMGEVHRLSNPGKIPVVLIEAQVGEYTGEDDIVRIEDDF